MALKPEFLGLLRDIRDRIFPTINTKHDEVVTMRDEVQVIGNSITELTVKQPVTQVPIQPSGEVGLPTAIYNIETGQLEFGIPSGKNGKNLEIKFVVDLIIDLYTLIPIAGDMAFVNENNNLYIKRDTNVNLNALDWTDGAPLTPATTFKGLTDTPIDYTAKGGFIPIVNSAEDGLEYIDFASKEPAITKNTAFNKNFGDGLTDVMRGNAIESGSNANGNWTKFPDGTLICIFNTTSNIIDTEFGTAFFKSSPKVWTFPMAFVGLNPACSITSGHASVVGWVGGTSSVTSISHTLMYISNTGSSYDAKLSAIGRWK